MNQLFMPANTPDCRRFGTGAKNQPLWKQAKVFSIVERVGEDSLRSFFMFSVSGRLHNQGRRPRRTQFRECSIAKFHPEG
jgi:hypothetical protein